MSVQPRVIGPRPSSQDYLDRAQCLSDEVASQLSKFSTSEAPQQFDSIASSATYKCSTTIWAKMIRHTANQYEMEEEENDEENDFLATKIAALGMINQDFSYRYQTP